MAHYPLIITDRKKNIPFVIWRRQMAVVYLSAVIALILSACGNEPTTNHAGKQPAWESYVWLGVRPLMSVPDAEKALAQRNFTLTKCNADDPVPDIETAWEDENACFLSKETGVEISLTTVHWKGAPHLSDIYYYLPYSDSERDQNNEAAVKERAEIFTKIYGPPDAVHENGTVTSYIWKVPGGSKTLPDTVEVRRGKWFAPETVMTSHWIHRQKTAADAATNKGGTKQ